ncbi:glycerol-3-phosphate acyltransferase [Lactobacillus sp. Sy-1]|nr:glycerol-3-phosphate 1-O-acyltransferase PlsY [Lactobacillus sp. Sy-1]MBW1605567.1 glycerol-3-phosphate acyltransferase [Lactobacillus sp. Sy-1]
MKIAVLLIIAYLLGSIPSGIWIGKTFFKVDVRQHGSGNIGTTNTFRVLGPVAGSVVLFMDIAKGSLSAALPLLFGINFGSIHLTELIFGLCAIIGHTFSIFDGFKGGKAVATSAGMLLTYNPVLFIMATLVLIFVLYLSSMVSLASLCTFIFVSIVALTIHDYLLATIAIILTIFVFYRHRKNIRRILNGTENLVHFGIKYKHQQH